MTHTADFVVPDSEDFDSPHALFADLRGRCPVAWADEMGGFWAVTRHADIAQVLTDSNVDDATTGAHLIDQVDGDIAAVIGDAAYDTRPFYDAAVDRAARVVVPPAKNAAATGRPCSPRDQTIRRVHDVGPRQWKAEAGYKTIIEDRLRARGRDAQCVEARLACNALNRMFKVGRPISVRIAK